jgi:hypothetical protein
LPPARRLGYRGAVTQPPDDRQARLAAALRENLRRRKARARAVDAPPPAPERDEPR